MADKYITREELRIEPYEINHEKVDDKYLEMLQDLTYALVNSFCNQDFEQEGTESVPVEKKVNGTGKDTVFLPKRLITLTKVKVYYATNDAYEYDPEYFIAKTKFVSWTSLTNLTARYVGYGETFPKGTANIGISGVWGWSDVPTAVKYLQGKLIQKIIDDKAFAQKFQSERVGDYQYEMRRNLQSGEEEITGDFELDRIIKQFRSWLSYGSF